MKLTRFIMLAAVMVIGLFGSAILAADEGLHRSTTATASAPSAITLPSHNQVQLCQQVPASDMSVMVLLSRKVQNEDATGQVPDYPDAGTNESANRSNQHGNVVYKPKIKYFTGVGNNFARAPDE